MTLKDIEKIDDKLTKIYENQVTTNVQPATPWVDRSDTLINYMNFIAMNNKSFLNLNRN